jgi:hypothetical protein
VRQNTVRIIASVFVGAATSLAGAGTIATFSDPAMSGATPLFTATPTSLVGGWSGAGLTLITPINAGTYVDATMVVSPITVTGTTLGAGMVQFFESPGDGGALILQIEFDSGNLFHPVGWGASYLSANDVTFSGPIIPGALTEETFAFSFANPVVGAESTTYTAAFTSSAVPEPGSTAFFVIGLAMTLVRRIR